MTNEKNLIMHKEYNKANIMFSLNAGINGQNALQKYLPRSTVKLFLNTIY